MLSPVSKVLGFQCRDDVHHSSYPEGGDVARSPCGPSMLGIGFRRALAVLIRGTP